MRFLHAFLNSFASYSQTRRGTTSGVRRRTRIELDSLETRSMLSIAGITLQFGNLAITGPRASGNVARVWIDSATHNVAVSLNGQSEEFAPRQVTSITYKSGANGGDTFENDTSLTNLNYGYGGSNHFTGGTGFNYIYFFGNNNGFNVKGGTNVAWKAFGTGDAFQNPTGASLTIYNN